MIVWIKIFYKKKHVYRKIRWIADWWPNLPLSCWYLLDLLSCSLTLNTTVALFKAVSHHWSVSLSRAAPKDRNTFEKLHFWVYFAAGIICKCLLLYSSALVKIWQAFLVFLFSFFQLFLFIMKVRWLFCFVTKEPYQPPPLPPPRLFWLFW